MIYDFIFAQQFVSTCFHIFISPNAFFVCCTSMIFKRKKEMKWNVETNCDCDSSRIFFDYFVFFHNFFFFFVFWIFPRQPFTQPNQNCVKWIWYFVIWYVILICMQFFYSFSFFEMKNWRGTNSFRYHTMQ